jgi:hypothetical protein
MVVNRTPISHHALAPSRFLSRRQWLTRCGLGMGSLALANLVVSGQASSAFDQALRPLAPRPPHFPAKAKRVVHIFANGGPSQVDTFDPKPTLQTYAGRPLPSGSLRTESKTGGVLPSPYTFKEHGESGIPISEIFPRLAEHADELCVIRSMRTDLPNHEASLLLMNCGDVRLSRPSVGSWITYGLGSENQNLPGFIVLCPHGYPIQESDNWRSAFLPGVYQGTFVDSQHQRLERLIEHVRNPALSRRDQRQQLDLLAQLNRTYVDQRPGDALVEARIESFELAFRMQAEVAAAFDLSRETKAIRQLYGAGVQGRQMLMARRLLEMGVRFVQVWSGAGQPWDDHTKIADHHRQLAGQCDQPIAALLADLKERGMLEDTLVLWGGEFGRTPTGQLPELSGRDHNHYGFTVWLAGGGVRGGYVHGATDDFGFRAVENPMHVHDLHATILHLLGFDHERLTYRYAGRDFRLTDVHGQVVRDLLA